MILDGLFHWYVVNLDERENGFHFGVRGFKTKSSAKKGLTKHFSRAIRL